MKLPNTTQEAKAKGWYYDQMTMSWKHLDTDITMWSNGRGDELTQGRGISDST